MFVEMKVRGLALDPLSNLPIIILRDEEDKRSLPIWIGIYEANAIALELEKVAVEDEYFASRRLYPNVDFYSGIIYQAMGFPLDIFPSLFAIGRTPGWLAQWEEGLLDPEQKITRPRQVYTGAPERDFVPMAERG